jgi:hypothetical protein
MAKEIERKAKDDDKILRDEEKKREKQIKE